MTHAIQALAMDKRLQPIDVRVAIILEKLAGRKGEVCHAAKTIAARIGCSRRSVELAIARLIECGYLGRIRDYALRTRRRLILLFGRFARAVPAPAPAPVPAPQAPPPSPPPAPLKPRPDSPLPARSLAQPDGVRPVPPHTPPISPTGKETDNDSLSCDNSQPIREPGPARIGSLLGRVVNAGPSSSDPSPDDRPEPRKATPEEVARVIGKARTVFPSLDEVDARRVVRNAAKRWSLSWVEHALDWAYAKHAQSWSYVLATLARMEKEGGPVLAPPKPKGPPPMQNFGPLSPESKHHDYSPEEISELWEMASRPGNDLPTRSVRGLALATLHRLGLWTDPERG